VPARTEERSLRRIFASVAPASLLVQIVSFGSSIVLATQLGASTSTDAYYLALSVPVIAYGVLLAGVRLGGIPELTRLAQDAPTEQFRGGCNEIVTATLVSAIGLSIVVTGILAVLLPILAGGSPQLAGLTREYMLELTPYAVTGAMLGAFGAVLAVRGHFAIATLVLAIEPILKSGLVLGFGRQLGVQALVIGNIAGNFLAVAVLWEVARRAGVSLRIARFRRSPVVASVLALSAPLVLSQAVLQLNPVIDRTTAAALGSGSVTELELGVRLFTAPVTLLTATMIAPLAATWSARLNTEGWFSAARSFSRVVAAVLICGPPLIVVGFILRHDIVSAAYSSHAYSAAAVTRTAGVLGMLLLGLIPRILIVPLSTLFVIHGDTIFPLKVGLANCVLNAGTDLVFRGPFGVAGIALSTSFTLALLCVLYVRGARRRWGTLALRPGVTGLIPLSVLSGVASALVAIAVHGLLQGSQSRPTELAGITAAAAAAVALTAIIMSLGGGFRVAGLRLPLARYLGPQAAGPFALRRRGVRKTADAAAKGTGGAR